MKASRLLMAVVCFVAIVSSNALHAETKPNILFIYTDDQSTRTVGCYHDAFDWVKTPHIDRLAGEGIRFTHAYIGAWCMASRATMLTGLHQHAIESMRMEGAYPGSTYDPEKCPFWPADFRKHGYTTAHIGKWHTGVDGGYGRDWDYQKVWNRPKYVKNAPMYYDNQLIETNGGKPVMTKGYTTDNYTDWALDYIKGEGRESGKPWMLWLCYGAVHGPFTPADRHKGSYGGNHVPEPAEVLAPRPGKPEYVKNMNFWERNSKGVLVERKVRDLGPVGMVDNPGRPHSDWVHQYHEGVRAIDESVGKLMALLKATGQDGNTLVIFTSDQGFAWGHHGFKSKVAPYQANVAAPLIFRGIKRDGVRKNAGKVVHSPVSGVDIAPTIYGQVKLPLPWKMHGHDLSPMLDGDQVGTKKPAMLVHTAKVYGSDTKKIPGKDEKALYHGPGIPWYVMLTEGDYKYVRTLIAGETEEFYDLRHDPGEIKNLAQDPKYKNMILDFRAKTIEELKRTDAGMVSSLPPVKKLN